MNEQLPFARVILTAVDMLRAVRAEILRLDKSGHPAIAGRPETQAAKQHSWQLISALLEIAARLSVLGDQPLPDQHQTEQ